MKRHKLRIKVKKLRYAIDFFASLFGHHKRHKLERALKRLQSALGHLNDIRVHGKLARNFAKPPKRIAPCSLLVVPGWRVRRWRVMWWLIMVCAS